MLRAGQTGRKCNTISSEVKLGVKAMNPLIGKLATPEEAKKG